MIELWSPDAVSQSNVYVAQELENTKQEIDDKSDIDLGQYGVFEVADAGLDLQVLLDETEEDLLFRMRTITGW